MEDSDLSTVNIFNYRQFLDYKLQVYNKLAAICPEFNVRHLTDVIFFTVKITKIAEWMKNSDSRHRDGIIKVLKTKNHLQNLDAHPIGLETSIDFYCNGAQKILNVKDAHARSQVENLNLVILHKPKKSIFKLLIKANTHENITKLLGPHICNWQLLEPQILDIEIKFGQLNTVDLKEETVYKAVKYLLQNCDDVLEIIYYSNCRLVDAEETDYNVVFSNAFKFSYCTYLSLNDCIYDQKHNNFILNLITQCTLLTKQKNFNTNKGNFFTPLSISSGEKAVSTIRHHINSTYYTGGPRDGLFTGIGTQLGGNSKSELIIEVAEN